jgi:uncharacterized protein YjdB
MLPGKGKSDMDWKKRLSVLLCLCLALSLMLGAMPAAALEEETPEAEGAETAFLAEDLPNAPRCVWQSARVTEPGEMVAYTLNSYSSKLTDPQVWLAVSTTADDQVLQLSFTNVSKGTYAYIFRASTLESADPSGSNYAARFSFNSAYTGRWHADYAGVYYVMLMPSASSSVTDTAAGVTVTLIEGDTNEPNGSPALATELTENVSTYFTLAGFNDQDWFKITSTVPGEGIKIYLSNKDYTVPTISARLFRASDCPDGTAPKDNLSVWNGDFTGNGYGAYKVTEPGVYYLRLTTKDNAIGSERPLRIRYEMIPGDAQELNDGQESAFTVPYDYPVDFNLNGVNDVDWFYFETTAEGEIVTLSLTGFETDYSNRLSYNIYNAVYDGLTGEMTGISSAVYYANDVNITYSRQMSFAEPGGHFIRIVPYNHAITETPLRLTLQSYAKPDSQEPNDTRDDATLLLEEEPVEFNLPIGDKDWFKFTADKPDQTLELTLTVPAGGSLCTWLYSGADFALSGDSAASMTSWGTSSGSGSGVKTYRYMLKEAGDYYVYVKPYNNNGAFDEEGTVTYRMIQPDEHERNNGYRTSATLNEEIAASFTLPAGNDVDWFRFVATEPNQTLELTLTIPAGGSVAAWLYSQAGFALSGDNAASMTSWATSSGSGSGVKTYRYMLGEAGDYYVCIAPHTTGNIFDEDATVSFRLIQPDEYERNNGFAAAAELAPRTAASITLPAGNDADWFHIGDLTSGDMVTVTWGGSTGSFECQLFYVDEYATSAVQASRFNSNKVSGSNTFTVGRDSNFYLCLSNFNNAYHDRPMWFRYAVTAADMPVTGIASITNGNRTIFKTQTLQLYANVVPANATNQNVTWTSSNPAAATVDENGLVTGVAVGETVITAVTVDGGYTLSASISVAEPIPVTGVAIRAELNPQDRGGSAADPYPLALDAGLQLTALVDPSGATELGVVWSVSDESVLAVNEYGKIFAIGSGAAQAIVTTLDGGFEARFYVNVPDEQYPVRGISLSENYKTLYLGEGSYTLTATVSPSYATNPDVMWLSSDEAVATVDQNGVVTPLAPGTVDITVCAAENVTVKNVCSITVKPPRTRVTGISFAESEAELGLYGTLQLTPIVAPADATDPGVTWTTDNKNIATVSRTGLVTGLNLGTAVITAATRDGGFTASVKVIVKATADRGDLDNDGAVDAGDAMLVLKSAVGLIALSEAQKAVADVNGDGEIDAGDAVLILRYDAGLIDAFPAE